MSDAPKPQPGPHDRVGAVAGAAPDLDLASAGFSAQRCDSARFENFYPAAAVLPLPGAAIEADDFGAAAQAAGEADEQHGASRSPPEIS
ncbi:hypothetical protein MPC4_320027 [Methylocella tundrae]|uniref:Uncharacterized protein n=1 Tax=Methylocella tundrae TaxID=227605 RepID=A0A8B6MA80_METTU|nr:hypothetical protein MPC1_3290002 [Methylocella tundrae]VTZ51195.1 hypothetical protein MPC4_320027 [Methylocella tundrae]